MVTIKLHHPGHLKRGRTAVQNLRRPAPDSHAHGQQALRENLCRDLPVHAARVGLALAGGEKHHHRTLRCRIAGFRATSVEGWYAIFALRNSPPVILPVQPAVQPAVQPVMAPFSSDFLFSVFSVVLIDILLAGDNAILIAMAVKSLPPRQRRIGIAAGAGGAVVLRIILTYFAAQLLQLSYLKLIGGVLILWIAVKLLTETSDEDPSGSHAVTLRHAIWLILVADVTMSTDNVLAVAAASKGSLPLLILGLGLSISFVVFTSSLLSRIMDRFPVVVWMGAALLGRVGAELMVSDPWVVKMLPSLEHYSIPLQVAGAAGVVLAGWLYQKRVSNKRKNPPSPRV